MDGRTGWADDGMSKGSMTFVRHSKDNWDVIIKDASGSTFSAKQDGAKILLMSGGAATGSTILLAAYPLGTVETFHLTLGADGSGELAMTSARPSVVYAAGTTPPRSSVFVSKCSR